MQFEDSICNAEMARLQCKRFIECNEIARRLQRKSMRAGPAWNPCTWKHRLSATWVARPSGDLLVAAHQKTSQDWWTDRRDQFTCYVSQVVIDEASAGDSMEAQKRLAVISALAALDLTVDAETLTLAILACGALPQSAGRDAAHIAVAAFHAVDYLLTWNCKHLANAQIIRKIESVCQTLGYRMPIICTPEELMGV